MPVTALCWQADHVGSDFVIQDVCLRHHDVTSFHDLNDASSVYMAVVSCPRVRRFKRTMVITPRAGILPAADRSWHGHTSDV